ncbi:MAG: amidohydrolase [Dehalococcoidia bacterium]|nr:amidohydrolase [Dehalococcoidia bacterium]
MIIDFHTHIFPPVFRDVRQRYLELDATFAALYSNPKAKLATSGELVASMDEAEVDKSVVMGVGWTNPEVAKEANDYIIESVGAYPSRLIGFCSVNPAWGSAAVEEAERCADAGLRGIGELHADSQGFDVADRAALAPLMDLANRRGLQVLVHGSEPVGHKYPGKGTTTPDLLYRMVRNFPDNVIVCAHWGGGLPLYTLMPELAAELKNVYFDSAASPFLYHPAIYSTVSDVAGPEHILFGTDYPLLSYKRSLEHLKEAHLYPEHRERILGKNAQELLGL